ncbi:hypothetical protein B0H14DRAFT_2607597 [Mycena olivaceomarginata]|nr:hypothetical protein B0H14DRAFT_2607597 [Mycena olivaceomarginata]
MDDIETTFCVRAAINCAIKYASARFAVLNDRNFEAEEHAKFDDIGILLHKKDKQGYPRRKGEKIQGSVKRGDVNGAGTETGNRARARPLVPSRMARKISMHLYARNRRCGEGRVGRREAGGRRASAPVRRTGHARAVYHTRMDTVVAVLRGGNSKRAPQAHTCIVTVYRVVLDGGVGPMERGARGGIPARTDCCKPMWATEPLGDVGGVGGKVQRRPRFSNDDCEPRDGAPPPRSTDTGDTTIKIFYPRFEDRCTPGAAFMGGAARGMHPRMVTTPRYREQFEPREEILQWIDRDGPIWRGRARPVHGPSSGARTDHHVAAQAREGLAPKRRGRGPLIYQSAVYAWDPVGINWFMHFVKRHPDLRTALSGRKDVARSKAQHDPHRMVAFYSNLARAYAAPYNIPENLYNVDEKGFMLRISSHEHVVLFRRSELDRKMGSTQMVPQSRRMGTVKISL